MTNQEKIKAVWDIVYSGDMPEDKLDKIEAILLTATTDLPQNE